MTTTATSDLDLPPGYRIDPKSGAWISSPWPEDPEAKALIVRQSLGPSLIDWAEGRGDGPGLTHYLTGDQWRFTPGQKRFLILWYWVNEDGRFVYRSGVKRGSKGTGKDPFAAAWLLGELAGPARLHDWDERTGTPVGAPHGMPLVQIGSNSEAQSKDVLRIANALLSREARDYYGIDCGETRTILRDSGGRLEVLTASEKSSEGDPATAIALNESHHMTESNGGHNLADVARRNVGKSPASVQARMVEFTNAHRQGYDSVGELSYKAWQAQAAGKTKKRDILYDSIEAPPSTDLYDDASRMAGLRAAYSDAEWADIERLSDEVLDPRTSVADSIRFYLNGLAAAEDAWIDPRAFDECARPNLTVMPGEQIAMFLDCSKSSDATGLVACRLSDGHVIQLGVWQKPHGDRGKTWLAPREKVDAAVRNAFATYEVLWFGVDPSPAKDDETEALYWASSIDGWHRDFRDDLALWAAPGKTGGNSVRFDMRLSEVGGVERNAAFTKQAERTQHDIDTDKSLTHDGSPALTVHVQNAKARPNKWGVSLGKKTRDSSHLVDLAVCMVGARLGRQLVLDSGALASKKKKRSGRVW
ncbi:hypothetical protein [Kineococcus radiotolerans]|uniref:Phage Terminase n=1 Tax=Kineococcus radiotolerans (strain ATCC BAA-149 / DSM 14245 / SRS30216) TaxID=266940 RepID=A6W8S0_KINRD|nr:hypothetical protein [Kineococcus radiotolerans]ABS03209.1 phage Terminase [Kineococcus radiotolerans SRS30216 = ATCC BAA-149]